MKPVLIDTNILIAWYKSGFVVDSVDLDEVAPVFSVITRIEALGFKGITAREIGHIETILSSGQTLALEPEVVSETIRIRQKYSVKTPDAIIAATALCNDAELWTANVDDFKNVKGLRLFNPLQVD